MLKVVKGQWMTAVITGAAVSLIGLALTELLKAPTYWRALTIVIALAIAVAIAFMIDRKEVPEMVANSENDNHQSAGIHFEGGHGNRAINNTIIGFKRGIVAKNETDFQAEGNDIHLPREDDK